MERYLINENKQGSNVNFLRTVKARNEAEAIKKAKAEFILEYFKAFNLLTASREVHKWQFNIYQPLI